MDGNEILLLGLGIERPWQLVDQRLDTDKTPHELHLEVKAERCSKYACPAARTALPTLTYSYREIPALSAVRKRGARGNEFALCLRRRVEAGSPIPW